MSTQRTIMILAFYLFSALYVLRAWTIAEQTLLDLGLAICMAVAVTLACIADSRILDRPMPHAAQWVMLFVWPIAVPIYLLWSRGRRGLIPLLTHAGIFCVLWLGIPLFTVGVLGIEPR